MSADAAKALVDPQGQPLRRAETDRCPNCGEGPALRGPSGGFGVPHPVCACGHEFLGEVYKFKGGK